MPRQRPHVLVVEPGLVGHQSDYLGALIDHWADDNLSCDLSLVVHPRFAALFAHLSRRLEAASRPGRRGQLIAVTDQELAASMLAGPSERGRAVWAVMQQMVAGDPSISHVCFGELDCVQLILSRGGRPAGGQRVGGFLFRPSVHYRARWGGRASWRERLRDLRKRWLYRFMLRNAAVDAVFVFDDYFAADFGAAAKHGRKLVLLGEPYDVDFTAAKASPAPPWLDDAVGGRVALLLFGALTSRKGMSQLFDAATELPAKVRERTAIILAGASEPAVGRELRSRIGSLRRACPELVLHLEDRFLPHAELHSAIAHSDVILAPYQRFVGSSGVVVLAAAAGKPIIAQDYGLVGARVRDHQLGVTVDSTDPVALARAISDVVEQGPEQVGDADAMRAFAASNQRTAFARGVFDALLAER